MSVAQREFSGIGPVGKRVFSSTGNISKILFSGVRVNSITKKRRLRGREFENT